MMFRINRPIGPATRLGLAFGALAFLQSMADPAEGLLSQPMQSLLRRVGGPASAATDFAAIVGLPWVIKPLFGAISDVFPLFGSRRKAYLILSAAVALLGFWRVHAAFGPSGVGGSLLGWLALATAGVAFSDVASDALMIEAGQPLGMTGRFQSIQWSSTYAAAILTGSLGGWLSQRKAERSAVAACGAVALLMLLVSRFGVEEPSRRAIAAPRRTPGDLSRALRMPGLWAAGGFLFLWNFNPFSLPVFRLYLIGRLGLSEGFYGWTLSLFAVACLAASLSYGFYCRLVPMKRLVHASVALGVAQTMAYWGVVGPRTAEAATLFAGFTYMTATLIQLDLAARICPPLAAGTAFALLMAMENLALSGSLWAGGRFYEGWGRIHGDRAAFVMLVGLGAATTAACWLLVPLLPLEAGRGSSQPSRLDVAGQDLVDHDRAGGV